MHTLYNIGISFLGFGMRIASLFNPKAKEWVHGRKNLFENLPSANGKEVIWFHCASLGEFDQGLPLMDKIKSENPSVFLLVTFFSPSGMNHYQKRDHKADHVMYLPLDTPSKARTFIKAFNPTQAFFVKYEFWSNFIFEAKKSGTTVYNVSGIFRKDHRFFKWYGGFFRNTLKQFDWFFVQNKASIDLLNSIGIDKASISGDSRFDRVIENKKNSKENEILANFKNGSEVFVVGSSWPEDETILVDWVNSYEGKVLIAPHNIDEGHVNSIVSKIPDAARYTQCSNKDLSNTKVLILDTIGQLANAYAYGTIAYVGGGFSGSLHNILEPAVFGLPVIFGPKHNRFPEAQEFIDQGIGFSVTTSTEFASAYQKITDSLTSISELTEDYVENNKGAAEKIYTHITSN
jgi:3-deoxy-D-manno-octulosonic-acid transferase